MVKIIKISTRTTKNKPSRHKKHLQRLNKQAKQINRIMERQVQSRTNLITEHKQKRTDQADRHVQSIEHSSREKNTSC